MLTTLFASLLGFISSAVPHLLKIWQDKQDKTHEIKILELQLRADAGKSKSRLDAIIANCDLAATKILHKTYNIGNKFIDGYNATVRPTVAYTLLTLYAIAKVLSDFLWLEDDHTLLVGVISYYFGYRCFNKTNGSNGHGKN